MKTSVIEVHDLLSALSVDAVEERIGEVPGVESVTVNFAAGSATVRYDETRLDVDDIKAAVRQRRHQSERELRPEHTSEHAPTPNPAVVPTPEAAAGAKPSTLVAAEPKAPSTAPAAEPTPAVPAMPVAAEPKAVPATPVAAEPKAVSTAPAEPQPTATRATRRRALRPRCQRIWRMRWAMAARTCRPWSATCATASGSV